MIQPGDLVARYRIEALLGSGGMGQVFSAVDTQLGRRVAVKVVLRAEAATEGFTERAMREARAAARLNHPNAVAVYDVGVHEGAPFVVMELVEGETLRERMARPATMAERVRWLAETARALGAAHREGLVHRDVKPDNVMVRPEGSIKVLDFGIARAATVGLDASAPTEENGLATLTQAGAIVGTPLYMAPEQLKREPLDGRADQYAWGVTAYQVLTGSTPFGATDAVQLIAATLGETPPAPSSRAPEISPALDAVVMRALAKRAGDRFEDMDKAAGALEAALTATATAPLPTPAAMSTPKLAKSNRPGTATNLSDARMQRWLGIAGATTAFGLGVWMLQHKPPAPTPVAKSSVAPSTPMTPASAPSAMSGASATAAPAPMKRHLCVEQTRKDDREKCVDASPRAWCDTSEKWLVCCAKGLAPDAAGTFCGCPPGGSEGHYAKHGCAAARQDYTEEIQREVKAHFDDIRACYSASVARRKAPDDDGGRIDVAFEIDPDGQTVLPRVRGASVPDATMQACVVARFDALRFPPPPDGQRRVNYPLQFSTGTSDAPKKVAGQKKKKNPDAGKSAAGDDDDKDDDD